PPSTPPHTLSLHDALPIYRPFFFAADLQDGTFPVAYVILFVALVPAVFLSYLLLILPLRRRLGPLLRTEVGLATTVRSLALGLRSEEHTSELQSRGHLVCR